MMDARIKSGHDEWVCVAPARSASRTVEQSERLTSHASFSFQTTKIQEASKPSLRAKRGNPWPHQKERWIASSLRSSQ
jgi:hypothetical protein